MTALRTLATTAPDDVQVRRGAEGWTVGGVWYGVDRPYTGGITVRTERLARRLEAAMRDGAAFSKATVCTDNAGRTYVHATSTVLARYLNADLRRLGY